MKEFTRFIFPDCIEKPTRIADIPAENIKTARAVVSLESATVGGIFTTLYRDAGTTFAVNVFACGERVGYTSGDRKAREVYEELFYDEIDSHFEEPDEVKTILRTLLQAVGAVLMEK